jgi:hypothetical protein
MPASPAETTTLATAGGSNKTRKFLLGALFVAVLVLVGAIAVLAFVG